jgi:hypothetical protein
LGSGLDIGAHGWLVEEYQRRASDQSDGRVETSPLTAGQLLRAPVEQLRETE